MSLVSKYLARRYNGRPIVPIVQPLSAKPSSLTIILHYALVTYYEVQPITTLLTVLSLFQTRGDAAAEERPFEAALRLVSIPCYWASSWAAAQCAAASPDEPGLSPVNLSDHMSRTNLSMRGCGVYPLSLFLVWLPCQLTLNHIQ